MKPMKRWNSAILAGVTALALTACVATDPLAPPPEIPPLDIGQLSNEGPYRLGADDEIRLLVFGQPDLSANYKLDDTGQISVPLIGAVDARGLSARELEGRLAQRLSEGFLVNPSVNVEVVSYRPIYILGEVGNSGRFDFQNNMNVVSAVAIAGGYTEDAVTSVYKVTRTVDGVAVTGRASQTTVVEPGDVIEVFNIEDVPRDILSPEEAERLGVAPVTQQ
ncbi:MAG: polysaccharide biosynthesis/export family protein [Pseudomonadota bacterium]